MAGGGEKNTSN